MRMPVVATRSEQDECNNCEGEESADEPSSFAGAALPRRWCSGGEQNCCVGGGNLAQKQTEDWNGSVMWAVGNEGKREQERDVVLSEGGFHHPILLTPCR